MTGGCLRQPASFCGVYGLKPTYGSVSRYGLSAYASSMDTLGIVSCSLGLAEKVFRIIRGEDQLDHLSMPYPAGSQGAEAVKQPCKRIAVLSDLQGLDEQTRNAYERTVHELIERGFSAKKAELPFLEYAAQVHYTIALSEASAGLSRYTGVHYGERASDAENPEELVKRSRGQGFGDEVKLKIILGTYFLRSEYQKDYYIRAEKIRAGIRKDLEGIFSEADLLLLPVYPVSASGYERNASDPANQKSGDRFMFLQIFQVFLLLPFLPVLKAGSPWACSLLHRHSARSGFFLLPENLRMSYLFRSLKTLPGTGGRKCISHLLDSRFTYTFLQNQRPSVPVRPDSVMNRTQMYARCMAIREPSSDKQEAFENGLPCGNGA